MASTFDDYFARYGPAYRWIATVTVMLASITVVLSATIVNVAVPDVMGTFGVGLDQAQWMATAFLAAMTISQLMSAWTLDCLGTRMTFVLMLCLFTIGALIAASAGSMEVLALGRTLQGIAAGVIQPVSMVVLALVFPPERRGYAMGIYSMGVVLAPTLGPAVGGITIDTLNWRYIFFLPLPMCGIAILLGMNFLPVREANNQPRPFDWPGVLVLAVAIVCLLTALSTGQRYGWLSDRILLLFVVSAIASWVFVSLQLRSTSPVLDFAVLRNSQFASACLIAFIFGSGLFATTYYIPVFVQTVLAYTPTQSGILLVPAGLGLMLVLPLAGRLADSIPAHYLIIFGLCVLSIGFMLMAGTDVNTSFFALMAITVFSRCGMGFIQPPLRTAAVRALRPELLARGSGTLNFFRQLGGAFGISALVIAVEQRTQVHSAAFSATQTSANETSRVLIGEVEKLLSQAGVAQAVQQDGAINYLGRVIHAQATSLAFQDAALLISAVFIVTVLPAMLLAKGKTTA
ncbi:MAG: DHA2 family efflux MFS transporter permease subunit [Gammaproteobacteria bacterium]|nr:DHA2 family efflux MFS transporter permease subunit [Gammaproteobacteria bacterium]